MNKLFLIDSKYYVVASDYFWAIQAYKQYFDMSEDDIKSVELVDDNVILQGKSDE